MLVLVRRVDAVRAHAAWDAAAGQKLFLLAAFQNTHVPLQVPARFLGNATFPCPGIAAGPKACGKQNANSSACRQCTVQTVMAMAAAMDEAVGNLTGALKAEGLWEQALMIFLADNVGGRAAAQILRSCLLPPRV